MKISREGQNLRKLIAEQQGKVNIEKMRWANLQDEARVAEATVNAMELGIASLQACLSDPVAKAEPPQPKRRGRKPKVTEPVEESTQVNGNGTIYECQNEKCKERFTRPAVVRGKNCCPVCDSTEFEPVVAKNS